MSDIKLPKINAADLLQALLLLDQVAATVVRIANSVKEMDGADETALKAQLATLRARNDERYTALEARLDELKAANAAPPAA